MSRSFAIRFYTKHDIDLLTLYYRNVDVANVMHQVLVAFIKGEEFLLSLPNPSEDDFQPQSTHGAKVEYKGRILEVIYIEYDNKYDFYCS